MTRYPEIVETLRREILSGKFTVAADFPSGNALAERFGVSRPTINRVMLELRQAGLVTTRPGAAPRVTRFAEHATGTLGVIHPGSQYGDVLSQICDSLVRQGERLGWDVALRQLTETDPRRRLRELVGAIRRFSEERVAGLFFQPVEYLADEASARRRVTEELSRLAFPVVLLDYDSLQSNPPRYDLVSMDNVSAGRKLGERLLETGARKIAFLAKAHAGPSNDDRMLGVASAVLAAGGSWSCADNLLVGEPGNRRMIRDFLRRRRPEAIVCCNDVIAMKLHETLRALGVADSVRVAGFDNQPAAHRLGIVSVAQPCEEIASVALQTLLSRLRYPNQPVHTVLVPDLGVRA